MFLQELLFQFNDTNEVEIELPFGPHSLIEVLAPVEGEDNIFRNITHCVDLFYKNVGDSWFAIVKSALPVSGYVTTK